MYIKRQIEETKSLNIGEGGVICFASELLPLRDKHRIIPVSFI